MTITIEAIYENGMLKPVKQLPLKEQEHVTLTLETKENWAERTYGMIGWTGDPETLRHVAEDNEFSVRERP